MKRSDYRPSNSAMAAVDVLIVDDHALLHETLGAAVRAVSPKARVHYAFELRGALDIAKQLAVDSFVLLDLGLPGCAGLDALHRFRKIFPGMRVAVVSATETAAFVTSALNAGASGYIPKTSMPDVLVAALSVVFAGGIYIPPQVLPSLAQAPAFTTRQLQVLRLIAKGASNREIAKALGIADNTAKQHTHAVFQALNVTSRTQAIVAAARLGIDLTA